MNTMQWIKNLSSASLSAIMGMALFSTVAFNSYADDHAAALDGAIAHPDRTPAYRDRDQHRHPKQTLSFFEVAPDHTVVEIWPGTGWYSEILAPYLKDRGVYYAAHFPIETDVGFFKRVRANYEAKLSASSVYDKVQLTEFHSPSGVTLAPDSSVDRILTFRNVHNWLKAGYEEQAFIDFYRALKPGGVLGVVEHRALPGTSQADMIRSGYMTEASVIELAQAAGFELVAKSEVNANPKDTKVHPAGVWTLPPTLRLKQQDREKYMAIGESGRMTLKFVKPQSVTQ